MDKQYLLNFEEYIKQGEPDKGLNCYAWQTGIGLQAVDGLKPSEMLVEAAKKNIEGEISIEDVKHLVDTYYQNKSLRTQEEMDYEEADKVSINIRNVLASRSFSFSVAAFLGIHEQIFKGVFKHAGNVRNYDISKKEWILCGNSVYYSNCQMIIKTLEYDFETERNFNYSGISTEEFIKHFSRFIANIWQVHPFEEGNTRTTAVFAIKYLHMLGFDVTNDSFINNSWYFRNALVRANYSNIQKNIHMDISYLELFFRNILLNENNILQNRQLHIDYKNLSVKDENLSVNEKNLPVKRTCSKILALLKENPEYTYEDLADKIGKTRETVRVSLRKLEFLHIIQRVGSDKTGHWEIISNY